MSNPTTEKNIPLTCSEDIFCNRIENRHVLWYNKAEKEQRSRLLKRI